MGSTWDRNIDGLKKAHWQTSLGFGSIPEAPQSRRHSFADVPTRHGSFSSSERGNELNAFESGTQTLSQGEDPAYFNTDEATRRAADARVLQSHQNYVQHLSMGQYLEPAMQPLYIVNFKCCRSDVFYIQEGTGLHVNVGDLVIVEADRGTDLGTVQHTKVSWEDARRYKEYYAEEHYKWLMMFSLQSRNGGPNVVNPNGISGRPGSAVGGMGPQGHHGHDGSHQELKPKLIRRLAQNHEIQALKDKEGNEAKAKRVCQQKVIEHRLNMEILDAEFQMDSKKLTFYYFADSYINFNNLVTDLFKVYKTRIWMSAINPASFQTPTASLGLVPAPAGQSFGANEGANGRQRPYGGRQQPDPMAFNNPYEPEPGMRGSYIAPPFPGFPPGIQPGQAPGLAPGMGPFGGNMPGDPFGDYYQPSYNLLNPNAPNFASGRPDMGSRASNQSPTNEWAGRFQGLSLGS